MLNGKSILITGGTGSFGNAFVAQCLKQYPKVRRLVVFSRDEQKQFEMAQKFSIKEFPCMRYFIGDIRDYSRLLRALEGVDIVIHAAALKQVPLAEYNPIEYIQTNIIGAQNLIGCCLDSSVERLVSLSTDKAAAPINLYGATKLCSDKLFVAANNYKGARDLSFTVVRYGNVMGSRGSVIPFFLERAKEGMLPITHPDMTRFNILLKDGVEMVFWALAAALGGEIFVPKIPSYRVLDLAEAIGPKCRQEIIGLRPGEKIHEEMITSSDSFSTIDLGNYYAILPVSGKYSTNGDYDRHHQSTYVKKGFVYNSGTNSNFLSVDEIRQLIREHFDPDFKPN